MTLPTYDVEGLDGLAQLRIYHLRNMMESCLIAGYGDWAQELHEKIVAMIVREKLEVQDQSQDRQPLRVDMETSKLVAE